MDATERIRRARQTGRQNPEVDTLPPSESIQDHRALQTIQTWIRDLGPSLGMIQREVQGARQTQREAQGRLQAELTALRNSMNRAQQERQRERRIAIPLTVALALLAGVVGSVIAPRISPESQHLQRLGNSVEGAWRAMRPAERKQLEKLLGWNQATEHDAR